MHAENHTHTHVLHAKCGEEVGLSPFHCAEPVRATAASIRSVALSLVVSNLICSSF